MEDKIHDLVNELQRYAPFASEQNASVSAGDIGWHIGHSLMSIRGILRLLEKSNPQAFAPKWSLARFYVMTFGKIPRGKGKAPERASPQEKLDESAIVEMASVVREKISKLKNMPPKAHFTHPYFGHLSTAQTVKFMGIHTRHHLAIIKEILRANQVKV